MADWPKADLVLYAACETLETALYCVFLVLAAPAIFVAWIIERARNVREHAKENPDGGK